MRISSHPSCRLAAGSNLAGQLGLGDRTDRVVFERVPFFRKFYAGMAVYSSREQLAQSAVMPLGDVVELACGLYHTLALCGQRVYAWVLIYLFVLLPVSRFEIVFSE